MAKKKLWIYMTLTLLKVHLGLRVIGKEKILDLQDADTS